MKEPVWVLPELVLAVHQMLVAEHGGLPGIRDQALLDSALARPQQKAAYESEASIFELAAAYSYGLARNHPFVDGNKRIALTIAAVFLELNGLTLNAPEAEAVIVYQQLAAGEIGENSLAEWLRDSSISSA
ncbi:MAG: type II toxin-antitoxin system death-on-curing family toxin [Chromatiaceae bacterium]|nr:type II toxin-antitoxin system death-on-curing family toxin [Planctomycetales bacterium]MCP5304377.1 type II toxin-antitoxin system death-on-curing family toxin [Chromatiaceae bacterium]MCP5314106.1 type II toxin-antitoxin system death-on-curing family toxin [Chromatiaceae bacterium]